MKNHKLSIIVVVVIVILCILGVVHHEHVAYENRTIDGIKVEKATPANVIKKVEPNLETNVGSMGVNNNKPGTLMVQVQTEYTKSKNPKTVAQQGWKKTYKYIQSKHLNKLPAGKIIFERYHDKGNGTAKDTEMYTAKTNSPKLCKGNNKVVDQY